MGGVAVVLVVVFFCLFLLGLLYDISVSKEVSKFLLKLLGLEKEP